MGEHTTKAVYIPGAGVLVTIMGTEGLSLLIGADKTVTWIEHQVAELIEWLS